MPTYVLRGDRFVDKATGEPLNTSDDWTPKAPQVAPDAPGIVDPIEGKWLEGRAARREYMKRHNVVEWGDQPLTPFRNEANRARYLGRGG